MSSLNKPQPLLYDFIREVKERVMQVYGHLPKNEKLNRLKQYTNNREPDGEIL
jgi:hypothetical protein